MQYPYLSQWLNNYVLVDSNRQVFDILPYVEYREGGFSEEEYGWPVYNHWEPFGYPTGYAIESWVYFMHGYDAGSVLLEMYHEVRKDRWNGNCFGLSLLAVAQYNGQINLKPYFERSGETLNEFGYDSIDQKNGKNLCALYHHADDGKVIFNTAIIQKIEQAQCSALSWEVGAADRTYRNGKDYQELLDYLSSDDAKPVVISLANHAVVTETCVKPIYIGNAALSAADKTFGKVDASAFIHSRVGEEDGIKPTSYTLLLDSETTVRCYFQLTGTKTIDEFTFTVDGVEVEPVYKDGYYYIEKANIAAHRLYDMHTFTCGNITITYGGLSYVNQVMTYYTSGTTFDMASALYAYSKAAEAYIG